MKISMIVAYGKNWEIGLDNQMLWHISEDFKNFKKITSGHHILMGRKTFESIGKALPNRTSLVLSKSGFKHDEVYTFSDEKEAFDFARRNTEEELFIIGGANIYKTLFNYVDKMYLSEVDFEGEADAFLEEIDFTNWDLTEQKDYEAIFEDGKLKSPAWKFKVYEKRD
ncbi:dihydrofolate reductase [Malaciobacter molluscorum LMG 25693]|uniref:Dihydrofolate reductase n=1 Tax=Malaciobacter molluscorum LMG 25693 TaxID=870501 RepID=A0A2G1DHJ6_9BACT|nr:dihydrofolate reductase [Malaciobacter molluscorum]AXX93335.1 dihydrofolate reductase [Malaciobacter molluscorum LMG 25693]PHO17989.1 dihydrofolate reductase [Malaciobacter molluscorum LMG 25693]